MELLIIIFTIIVNAIFIIFYVHRCYKRALDINIGLHDALVKLLSEFEGNSVKLQGTIAKITGELLSGLKEEESSEINYMKHKLNEIDIKLNNILRK